MVVGLVLLVVVLAFGLWYTRSSEGFTTARVMEGFNQDQIKAACKTIDEQIQNYKKELEKPPATEEMKKLHNDLKTAITQMETSKKQYGCPA